MSFTTKEIPNTISIRRLARELNLNYSLLLKASKRPIEGQVYDPTAVNYAAMDEYITKRVDAKVLTKIDWDAVAADIVVADPLPKEFALGQKVQLRGDDNVYEIIFMTATHTVINPLTEGNTQPRVMNNQTFLHQGPRVATEPAEDTEAIEQPLTSHNAVVQHLIKQAKAKANAEA